MYFPEQQVLTARQSEIQLTATAAGRTATLSLDYKKLQMKQAYCSQPVAGSGLKLGSLCERKAVPLKWWNT